MTRYIRQAVYTHLVVCTAILWALALPGCAPKNQPQLSPQGVAAYQATQAVKALDILRDAAIGAEAQDPKLLSTEATRKVVLFHRAAVQVIGTTPEGWRPTVTAALDQLQRDLLPPEWERLEPYLVLIRALITGGGQS